MKKILFFITILLYSHSVFSKTPDGYSYQLLLEKNPEYKTTIEQGIQSISKSTSKSKNIDSKQLIFKPLKGGATATQLFVFYIDKKPYVLRLVPQKTNIDARKKEIQASTIASKLGVGQSIAFSDDKDFLILITPFIEGHTLTKKDLEDKTVLKHLGEAIKKIREYSGEFSSKKTQVYRAEKHYQRGQSKHIAYPSKFQSLFDQYIKDAKAEQLNTFSHGDLNPSNIIVSGDKIFIIDWATAAMDYPYADLGYITFLSGMKPEQIQIFLESALGRKPSETDLLALCEAQKRIAFLSAVLWFDFSESSEDQKIPLQTRIATLDQLLQSPDLKTGKQYIQSNMVVNPKTTKASDIKLYALGFLKDYLNWKCP